MRNPESYWFGREEVTPEEKTSRVLGVFDSVASRYDLMNDLMSGGIHRLWKNQFVRQVAPKAGQVMLDVAGGTGDIAFRLHRAAGGEGHIIVYDINKEMLDVGQDRAIDRGILDGIEWVEGNAETLPFPDHFADVYTIAFGLRNVTRIDNALAEAYRVLNPGGRFFCLEFSRVVDPILAGAYRIFSDRVIPRLGRIVAQDEESYQYLVDSIRAFPDQESLAKRLKSAGFDAVRYQNLTGGVAAIHVADKY